MLKNHTFRFTYILHQNT